MSGNCVWCRREPATENLSFGWLETTLLLCPLCARLLAPEAYVSDLHDDLDVRYLAHNAVDHRLAEVYSATTSSSDRCWWCTRPGAPIDCTSRIGGTVLFDAPVLCDVCIGLSGHVGGGFAYADEEWNRAVDLAFDVIKREAKTVPCGLRERAVELVIVKLFLLEMDAHQDDFVYPCDGFSELASSLGLAEDEARAQMMRLWNEPDSPVTFQRFHNTVVPVLSDAGRLVFAEIDRAYRAGPPYIHPALKNQSVRRTLDLIAAERLTLT